MIDLPPQSRWALQRDIKLYEVDYSREGEEPDLYLEPKNDVTARDGPKLLTGRKVTARTGSVWGLQTSSGFYPYSVLLKGTGECEGDYWVTNVEKLEAWFRREGEPETEPEVPIEKPKWPGKRTVKEGDTQIHEE